MFEFEEAGGLHDVFLNKHAVSWIKNIFLNFERQMFNKKFQDGGFISFTHTCITGNVDCYDSHSGRRHEVVRARGLCLRNSRLIRINERFLLPLVELNFSFILRPWRFAQWSSIHDKISLIASEYIFHIAIFFVLDPISRLQNSFQYLTLLPNTSSKKTELECYECMLGKLIESTKNSVLYFR